MCIPPMALMSQNKRINPPTAYKANTQLEGFVWEGGSTKDNRVGNGTSFPGVGGGGRCWETQVGMPSGVSLERSNNEASGRRM